MNWEEIVMLKRVLVVDDDDMNLMRTKKILGNEYDVFFAKIGRAHV